MSQKSNRFFLWFKQYFYNKYFIIACAFLIIMYIVVLMGNPRLNKMPIHFIPEMISSYFVGLWQYSVKTSFKHLLFLYFVTVFLTPIFLGISWNFLLYLIVIPIPAMLAAPMLIAYGLAKWFLRAYFSRLG